VNYGESRASAKSELEGRRRKRRGRCASHPDLEGRRRLIAESQDRDAIESLACGNALLGVVCFHDELRASRELLNRSRIIEHPEHNAVA
jgi:hypothetical protein